MKELVANGFPVVIERGGMDDPREGWMGHYGIIAGYDDEKQEVTIPDSYLGWIQMSYEDIEMYWAQFDDIYMVIFPYEREQEVHAILGQQMDDAYNKQYALDQVTARLYTTKGGRDLFLPGIAGGVRLWSKCKTFGGVPPNLTTGLLKSTKNFQRRNVPGV